MQGWIKLHRKILSSSIFQNPNLLKFWLWCLLKATHCGYKTRVGIQEIELKEGQFVFGRERASVELNMKPTTVYKYLKQLESENFLETKSNNKFSVVTIVNWVIYQQDVELEEQQNDNKMTTKEQQRDTNKNVKNNKNVKEERFTPPSTEEVKEYCLKRKNNIDADNFHNFYSAKGWMVGKNKMKDWQAAIRTWEQRDKKNKPKEDINLW